MLKDVLAVVQGSERGRTAAQFALGFAQLHQAHLGLTIATERLMWTAMLDPMGAYLAEPEREREHMGQMEAFRALADASPVDCDIRGIFEEVTFIPGQADLQSRCADLVLIGPESSWSDRRLRRHVIDAVLIDAAAPVLLFPPDLPPRKAAHAVLGWNESAEASRAARALHQLVEPGGSIDVVIVEPLRTPDGRAAEPGRAIVEHYARHGFEAELHVCPAGGRPVAEVLESFATMRKAQLLAVGAYAHSRVRELLLGGATRDLIDHQRLPVLMVH